MQVYKTTYTKDSVAASCYMAYVSSTYVAKLLEFSLGQEYSQSMRKDVTSVDLMQF